MNKLFYPKLAAMNIKKNARTYVPFILAAVMTVSMFYIMRSLSWNDGLKDIARGSDAITTVLAFGCSVIAIFAVIFLFYTNSFLIKRRQREFGLFNILGMEKKHLAAVMFFETVFILMISLAVGLAAGIALDKLMYLFILKLLGASVTLGFYVSVPAILVTISLFGTIFLLILLNSLRHIHLSKPIELLKSENAGEREPKSNWVIALLGVLCLGGGYGIAITVQDPLSALNLFFAAVVLVILGTYFIFTAGSIALLKILRKNKRYYYKTPHFIGISGMLYRMKQNAVGLANICVLSTMVLVMISTTTSMLVGADAVINTRYPHDIVMEIERRDEIPAEEVLNDINEIAESKGLKVTELGYFEYLALTSVFDGNQFITDYDEMAAITPDGSLVEIMFVMSLDDYNRENGDNRSLADGEILLYRTFGKLPQISICGRDYTVKEMISELPMKDSPMTGYAGFTGGVTVMVVKDAADLTHLSVNYDGQGLVYETHGGEDVTVRRFYMDLTGTDDEKYDFYDQLIYKYTFSEYGLTTRTKMYQRDEYMELFSSLFFIGIALGLLFTMATILIIYYKQISEGYDDRRRFEIMQQVGLSHSQVRRSISSQILTVFFLPLITAGVHICFAYPIIDKILTFALGLSDSYVYIACTTAAYLIFAALYTLIYIATARTYYKIIKR